jgi:7-keto-8-aminopelargonate synthetase-like enzyme
VSHPLDSQTAALSRTGVTRFFRQMFDDAPDLFMKNMTVEEIGPGRMIRICGKWIRTFGSDSFLGLDQHPAVKAAVERGVRDWGTHNGTSRAFSSVAPQCAAEAKIAKWLGTEDSVIFPSVTSVNTGALPALVTRHDVIVADQNAHNSIDEGMRLVKARGVRTAKFEHNDPAALEKTLRGLRPYRRAVIAVDGVYSMSGQLPPLVEFQRIAHANDAFLYVDDAHGTGVLGTDALGNYDNTLVIGSLSKGVSCLGGFIAGNRSAIDVVKLRSNALIFGGPVPPPYLVAVCAAIDVINSPEYPQLRAALDANVRRLFDGASALGLAVLGGKVPIVSILVGAEETTLQAGRFLFDAGYYVQSVIFPAVPHGAGVLRIQVNANHPPEAIDGLLAALGNLSRALPLLGSGNPIRIPAPAKRPDAIPA